MARNMDEKMNPLNPNSQTVCKWIWNEWYLNIWFIKKCTIRRSTRYKVDVRCFDANENKNRLVYAIINILQLLTNVKFLFLVYFVYYRIYVCYKNSYYAPIADVVIRFDPRFVAIIVLYFSSKAKRNVRRFISWDANCTWFRMYFEKYFWESYPQIMRYNCSLPFSDLKDVYILS